MRIIIEGAPLLFFFSPLLIFSSSAKMPKRKVGEEPYLFLFISLLQSDLIYHSPEIRKQPKRQSKKEIEKEKPEKDKEPKQKKVKATKQKQDNKNELPKVQS